MSNTVPLGKCCFYVQFRDSDVSFIAKATAVWILHCTDWGRCWFLTNIVKVLRATLGSEWAFSIGASLSLEWRGHSGKGQVFLELNQLKGSHIDPGADSLHFHREFCEISDTKWDFKCKAQLHPPVLRSSKRIWEFSISSSHMSPNDGFSSGFHNILGVCRTPAASSEKLTLQTWGHILWCFFPKVWH